MKFLVQHTARRRRGWAALTLAAALAVAGAAPAAAVTVTAGTGSGLAGQTVDIAITTTSTSGLNIRSLQFDLTYNAAYVTATDVLEAGDLVGTAGWGNATFNVTSGKISVSHAGSTALSGAGALLHVRFTLLPLTGGTTALTLSNFVFNEGTPSDTTANGSITVNPTPVIQVSPDAAELVRGQTLQFSVTGGVVNPVTWSTTNATVASISGTGLLTANAPGTVRVHAVDNAARSDDSDGDIVVRGMGVTVGSGITVFVNNSVDVPITVTSLTGLGIRAGQVTLTYNPAVVTPTGVVLTGGLLNGWGAVAIGTRAPGTCTVDFVGNSDLAGSGTLCKVTFLAGPTPGSTGLAISGLFNENLIAKPTNGSIGVSALPALTVNPDTWSMFSGDTKTFTVAGTPVPPVRWSVTDTTVAKIDSTTGVLTALKGGTIQVKVHDNVGAFDLNTSVEVYDFQVSLGQVNVMPGSTVNLPVLADRKVGALNIRSVQYELQWSSGLVTNATPSTFGLIPAAWPGSIAWLQPTQTRLRIAAAGSQPLANTDSVLHRISFTVSPSATNGTDIPISLSSFLANEGAPRVLIGASGILHVRTTVDVPDGGVPDRLQLAEPWPNPGDRMVFAFGIPAGGADGARVRLDVVGVDGRRVRTLVDGVFLAGRHESTWDGRDDHGRAVPAGIYFARLQGAGGSQVRKLVRLP